MKSKNKKIKDRNKRIKVTKARRPSRKKIAASAAEGVLGATLNTEAAAAADNLGSRILVQEVKDESMDALPEQTLVLDIAETENIDNNYSPEENLEQDTYDLAEEDINGEQEFYADRNNFTQRQKKIIMYVAITSIMAVLIGFWLISVRATLSQNFLPGQADKSQALPANSLKDAMNEMKNGLFLYGDYASQQINQVLEIPEQTKEKIIENKVKNETLDALKEKLNNLNNNVNSIK